MARRSLVQSATGFLNDMEKEWSAFQDKEEQGFYSFSFRLKMTDMSRDHDAS